jgi:D-3-phosphoglycerate dehydrogenase
LQIYKPFEMNDKKIIIITAKVHTYLIESLEEKGYTILYLPEISYKELLKIVDAAQGLIITTRIKIDKVMLDKAINLKWIGRLGSGMELVDTIYAASKGVRCISTPEGNKNAVAEHAVGLILNLLNNITPSYLQIKEGKWIREDNRGIELSGKTIGIIGYGHTGSAFAKVLEGFKVVILAYDKYKTNFGNDSVTEASLAAIAEQAEIISFHLPLNDETRHLCNIAFLTSLQKTPYIINTSRGEVIHTGDLIKSLQQQLIAGAALDVLENENLDTLSPKQQAELEFLTNQKNVLITPHIAGYSHESFQKMSNILLEKLCI